MAKICQGQFGGNLKAIAVVMAGGFGTRFWPFSRRTKPKQFLSLSSSSRSLIQLTVDRLKGLIDPRGVLVVTGESLVDQVREHLPQAVIMAEPIGRNTAPCIGLAALHVLDNVGDVPILCLAADHLVVGEEALRSVYVDAIKLVTAEDVIVTIGINPTAPVTGYGYIHRGLRHQSSDVLSHPVYAVSEFKEKPNLETAKRYIESGDYYWNNGTFIAKPSVLLKAIDTFVPELGNGLREIRSLFAISGNDYKISEIFKSLPSISIDIGVAEKADNVVVIPGDGFQWSDIGSWDSWAENMEARIAEGETNYSSNEAIFIESSRCAVMSKRQIVGIVGLDDIVVVDTDDALLICRRGETQEVKQIIEYLQKKHRTDLL